MATAQADAGTELIEDFFPEDPSSNPEPKAEPGPEAKPVEKPKHPAYLVKAAKNLQFSDKEIEEYSPSELKEAIQIVTMTRTQDRKEQQVLQEVQRDAQTGRFVKQEQAAPAQEPEFSLKDLGVDLSDADDFTQKLFTKALKPLASKLADIDKLRADLEAKIGEINDREQQRVVNGQMDELDRLFVTREDIYGKGNRFKMVKGSPEHIKRQAAIASMSNLFKQEEGLTPEECFERVSDALFGKAKVAEPESEPEKKVAKPRHDFSQASTVQPTAKAHAAQPKGHNLAVQNLANRMKVPAITNGEPSEFDELPD